ncbi:FdtA/QdtA family cupin domain-containing protein [Hymenobacter sp. BT186]|uniref:FdtA/QdtA family cupin domain-containing protein n=1 Tax=Hymenobacter telluris TaxID=2816474 RepID=A0A939ETT6_9BACT|nr:FdtA/QdtA family cupin domain-containing protein [Hymenobacter telluris]MBO0357390.1 FdtA/QdtA family cupin domain-containing protein [Hymenobacter telluris]MBW3373416.1 FdtA/QdtA family cupin domain-containing protein [Hymenobacter norwichensis]
MEGPYLIEFPKVGASDIGFISIAECPQQIPFEIKRTFWTYYTPESVLRGRHAHHRTEQVLVAVAGRIIVTTELSNGEVELFRLEDPHVGLYIPPYVWHTMQYSHSAVQLVMASLPYNAEDYIRDHSEFQRIWKS